MTKTKKLLSYFFIALFTSYYGSTAFFSHLHIISGATIYHSHIHANSHHDTKSGNHTEKCITLIAQISQFQYIDFSCNCILKPLQFPIQDHKFVATTHWIPSIHLENTTLRAPPVFV